MVKELSDGVTETQILFELRNSHWRKLSSDNGVRALL